VNSNFATPEPAAEAEASREYVRTVAELLADMAHGGDEIEWTSVAAALEFALGVVLDAEHGEVAA
jgi:hypothetical protein